MFVPTGNFVETFGRLCDGGSALLRGLAVTSCDLAVTSFDLAVTRCDLGSDLRDGVVVDLCDDQLVHIGGGLLVVARRG